MEALPLGRGAVDVGTGSDTTLRQIAAETLGVDPESIALVSADTATTPYDPGSYASATVFITGEAVRKAASELKRRIESGDDFPTVTCENRLDRSSLGFAVQGIEVEVDEVTGKVVVTKAVQAVDLGKAVNPSICRGQVEGGMAMGVGYTLFEEQIVGVDGSILNPTFRTYRIPAATDIPPMEVHLVESNDPHGPMGAKCVGEICINPVAPAIANAIADAVGIRFTILPITPERVWEALAKRKENSG